MIWKAREKTLDLITRARVMGIVNATPDSFSDGGLHHARDAALRHANQLIAEGAEIIDVGGESTRPGANAVNAKLEVSRTAPVIEAMRGTWDGWISIDTMKASVARTALLAGADVVNDVSGLRADPMMMEVCAESRCGVVVMHMRGEPRTMQASPSYHDVVGEIREFFEQRRAVLRSAGIVDEAICYDPGIGFGKTLEHNLALLRELGTLAPSGRPLMLGISRKSLIGRVISSERVADRDAATVALTAQARAKGIMLHRVHAVSGNVHALRMVEAVLEH